MKNIELFTRKIRLAQDKEMAVNAVLDEWDKIFLESHGRRMSRDEKIHFLDLLWESYIKCDVLNENFSRTHGGACYRLPPETYRATDNSEVFKIICGLKSSI